MTLYGLSVELKRVWKAISKDLLRGTFFYVPKHFAKYHYDSLSVFSQRELYGEKVIANLPNAVGEMRAAGNCYATGNNTACVFHLMRAVEYGLRAVFKKLKIKFPVNPKRPKDKRPIEEREWGEISGAIEAEVKKLELKKKTRIRDEKIELLRGVNNQFKYFKNKWRNNVMHTKESYEVEDATKTMRQVQDFMEHLADYIKE